MQNRVDIWTDGSCVKDNKGGWGVVLINVQTGEYKELSGHVPDTTSNRMELTAVIKGLEALLFPCDVKLFSDSKYVSEPFNRLWLRRWINNGWKKSDGETVVNQDLWEQLHNLTTKHSVQFIWVKGHNGTRYNEICDRLANTAAKNP